jgi:hypothetical protein
MKYIHEKSNVYVCDDVNQVKVFPGRHNFMGFTNEPGKGQYLYLENTEESRVAIFRPTMSNACVIKLKEIPLK